MREHSIRVPDGCAHEECGNETGSEGVALLPCLNSNISTEISSEKPLQPPKDKAYSQKKALQKTASLDPQILEPSKLRELSTQHKKTAYVLQASVEKMANDYTLEHIGFLTLTFAEHITDPKEAQTRLNSLLSHVIKKRYREYLGVMERQRSGRIHYHLLVVLNEDIRTGFNWSEALNGTYSSANPSLRKEWSFWRKTAKAYRFGRTELLPVRTTIEAMARYVGKYIGKAIEVRKEEDKGVRLVRYSRGARAGTTRFQFNTEGSSEWRRKTAIFV